MKSLTFKEDMSIDIPEEERNYYLETKYPAFGNLVPRDVASRAAKEMCDQGYGVGNSGLAVYLDFKDAISKMGRDTVEAKYGNLFQLQSFSTIKRDCYLAKIHQ